MWIIKQVLAKKDVLRLAIYIYFTIFCDTTIFVRSTFLSSKEYIQWAWLLLAFPFTSFYVYRLWNMIHFIWVIANSECQPNGKCQRKHLIKIFIYMQTFISKLFWYTVRENMNKYSNNDIILQNENTRRLVCTQRFISFWAKEKQTSFFKITEVGSHLDKWSFVEFVPSFPEFFF